MGQKKKEKKKKGTNFNFKGCAAWIWHAKNSILLISQRLVNFFLCYSRNNKNIFWKNMSANILFRILSTLYSYWIQILSIFSNAMPNYKILLCMFQSVLCKPGQLARQKSLGQTHPILNFCETFRNKPHICIAAACSLIWNQDYRKKLL